MKYIISEKQFEPHVRIRKWFYRLVFWMLALMLLLALVRHSDWNLTLTRLLDVPKMVLVLCTLGWLSSFFFRAFRFKSEWKAHGKISLRDALSLTFLHNAAVVLVPFRVGELGYPVLVQRLLKVSLQQCIRSLLWLRLQDGIVLLALAFLLLPFFSSELRIAVLLVAMILCFVTIAIATFSHPSSSSVSAPTVQRMGLVLVGCQLDCQNTGRLFTAFQFNSFRHPSNRARRFNR